MNDIIALAVIIVGLVAGMALNQLIAHQLEVTASVRGWQRYTPLAGALHSRSWLALTVELLSALMAFVLWQRYGLSARSLLLFAVSLVLIDTGAVDFKIRMIDTLVLLVATVATFALAPVNAMTWLNSGLGVAVAAALFLFFFLLAKTHCFRASPHRSAWATYTSPPSSVRSRGSWDCRRRSFMESPWQDWWRSALSSCAPQAKRCQPISRMAPTFAWAHSSTSLSPVSANRPSALPTSPNTPETRC